MLRWLANKFYSWADRAKKKRIEIMVEQNRALKAEIEKRNGGKPIVLSSEDRKRLRDASEGIDPDRLKQISVLGVEESIEDESRQDST